MITGGGREEGSRTWRGTWLATKYLLCHTMSESGEGGGEERRRRSRRRRNNVLFDG